MAFQHHTIEANGVSLHVVEGGDAGGQPILWLHGITSRWVAWEPIVPHIPGRHFMVEFRGHGESGKPEGAEHYRWTDYRDDIVALIDTLSFPHVAIVGSSLGAITATLVAAREPERVVCAVAVDPPYMEHAMPMKQFAELRKAKHLPTDQLVSFLASTRPNQGEETWQRTALSLQAMADGPLDAMIAGTQGKQQLDDVLPRITQPFLVLQADPMKGAALSDKMAERVMALLPNGHLVRFSGSGHVIAHDQPEAFVAAVKSFLT